jgi:transcriptional regulator with XRE-family HTH domain
MMTNKIGNVSDAENLSFAELGKNTGIQFNVLMKSLRLSKNVSARGLSTECGFSPSYISKIESGDLMPSIETFSKIVQKLGCTDQEILFMIGTFYT